MGEFCHDTHLNSPLSNTLLGECLDHLINDQETSSEFRNGDVKRKTLEIQELLDIHKVPCLNSLIDDIQCAFPILWNSKEDTTSYPFYENQRYKEWKTLLHFGPKDLTKLSHKFDDIQISHKLSRLMLNTDATMGPIYTLRMFFQEGVALTASPLVIQKKRQSSPSGLWNRVNPEGSNPMFEGILYQNHGYVRVLLSPNYCLIDLEGKWKLATRNHFLCISDLISQRYIALLASQLGIEFNRENYPSQETLNHTFDWGDTLIMQFKNQAFNSISLWEGICTAIILAKSNDPVVDSQLFLGQMKESFLSSQAEGDKRTLENYFDTKTVPFLSSLTNHHLFQIFGLYRLWGHPTINETEGIKKLKSIACKPKCVNFEVISLIHCKWREYFSMNYYRKHKRWPMLEILPEAPVSPLITALRDGHFINSRDPGYSVNDWRYINFKKTFNVPEKFELSEMIADKATSHHLEELKRYCKETGTIGPAHTRSVIMQWLNTSHNNPTDFLKKIEMLGFDPKEVCVGVHPKERELKIFARLFGLLTIEKRLYVVLTEAMLADQIFDYFPEITMTFNAVTLQTRIHRNTKLLSSKKDGITIIVNLDFNKWNSYMREEETKSIFKDFDHLFGMENVFTRTHEMFSQSLMYLADGTITPFTKTGQVINDERVWTDHKGGIEGLRQKGWTIFTVVILKFIAEQLKVDCEIMGQGDNQVLILKYHSSDPEVVKRDHQNFMEHLNHFLNYIGPPLKLEESWSSSKFFIYGKFPVYDGQPLGMSLKKICRLMRLTNEGMLNLDSTLSSISANASAATSMDYDCLIPFIIGKLESIGAANLYLDSPFYQEDPQMFSRVESFRIPEGGVSKQYFVKLTDQYVQKLNMRSSDVIAKILQIPSSLGGYPTLQVCDLMNHGFPDPVSLNTWGLKHLFAQCSEESDKLFLWNILTPEILKTRNYEMLCQDPVSLNIKKPSSGTEKIKRMIFTFMAGTLGTKNEKFSTFMKLAKTRQTDLTGLLSTMRPLNPRIAHAILESTISGRAMRIVSKINKSNVIVGLMMKAWKNQKTVYLEEVESRYDEDVQGFRNSNKDLRVLYNKFERNQLIAVINMALISRSTNPQNDLLPCSVIHATKLREASWGPWISGVTVAPPQEMMQWYPSDGIDCGQEYHGNSSLGYILVRSLYDSSDVAGIEFNSLDLPSGPFKPFFGSTTQNKVKFEGNEIKKVAPPILKGILELMCLPGWATGKDSHLSKLLNTVFSTFTDLPTEYVIPSHLMISGTWEHRYQDNRTSHSATLSVLYHFSTMISVITNMFDPKQKYEDPHSDNFNINFQAILTWIGGTWSSMMINKNLNCSKSYHIHVGCIDCIQFINETQLEIEDPSKTIQAIERTKDTTNPYCWIPKESLIGDNEDCHMMEIQEENQLEKIMVIPELAEFLAAAEYIEEFPIIISDYGLEGFLAEKSFVVPVSTVLKMNILTFLQHLNVLRIISYLYIRSPTMNRRNYASQDELIAEIKNTLRDTNIWWFKGLISSLLNVNGLKECIMRYPDISPPKGTPPSELEKCGYFTRLSDAIVGDLLTCGLPGLSNFDAQIYKTRTILCHPIIRNLVGSIVRSDSLNKPDIRLLGQIRLGIINSKRVNTILSVSQFSGVLETKLTLHDVRKLQDLETHLLSIKPKWFIATSYSVLRFQERLRAQKIPTVEPKDIKSQIPLDDVKHLPPAVDILMEFNGSPSSKLSRVFLTPRVVTLSAGSLINHYFKTEGIITTANYKLLTIMNFVFSLTPLPKIIHGSTIGCFGDGTGGYSVLMGRLFPESPIAYNTLFEISKLSSVGIDNFIPAALSLFPDILNRVISLTQTTEGVSDLTNDQFPKSFGKLTSTLNPMICDAEGGGWEDPTKGLKICETLLKLAVIKKTGIWIIKSYLSRSDMIIAQILMVLNVYKTAYLVRSQFSTMGSSEVFIVALHQRSNPQFLDWRVSASELHPISLQTNIPITEIAELVEKAVTKLQIVSNKPLGSAVESYSSLLSVAPIHAALRKSNLRWMNQQLGESGTIIVPLAMIKVLRKELNLVRFSHTQPTRMKLNFLSTSVTHHITISILRAVSLVIHSFDDLELFEAIISNYYLGIFETVDGAWSINIGTRKNAFKGFTNVKIVKISEVIKGASHRELLIMAGRLREIVSLFKIKSLIMNLQDPWIPFNFESELRLWPEGFTPLLSSKYNKMTHTHQPSPVVVIRKGDKVSLTKHRLNIEHTLRKD